jgi:hypothetical protein
VLHLHLHQCVVIIIITAPYLSSAAAPTPPRRPMRRSCSASHDANAGSLASTAPSVPRASLARLLPPPPLVPEAVYVQSQE